MTRIYEKLVQQDGLSNAQQIIVSQVANNTTVLEIGSSSGYITRLLQQKGCLVDIVEVDLADAKKAASFANKSFAGSIEDKATQSQIVKQYDYILCADVLEHLVDPEKVLQKLKENLKKDGQLLISIPNVAFWGMRKQLLIDGDFSYQESGLLDRTHLRFYSLNNFLNLLKKNNLKVSDVIPAETRIPFELSIKKIPILGQIFLAFCKNAIVNKWPNLTYYHYVVKASK